METVYMVVTSHYPDRSHGNCYVPRLATYTGPFGSSRSQTQSHKYKYNKRLALNISHLIVHFHSTFLNKNTVYAVFKETGVDIDRNNTSMAFTHTLFCSA